MPQSNNLPSQLTFLLPQRFKTHVITLSRHLKQPSNNMTIIKKVGKAAGSVASTLKIQQRLNNSNRKELEDHTSPSTDGKSKPPPYGYHGISDDEARQIVAEWDTGFPSGLFGPEITLKFVPEMHQSRISSKRMFRSRKEEPTWEATLNISTSNIPRLMLNGLHFSTQNFIKGSDRLNLHGETPLAFNYSEPSRRRQVRIYHLRSDHNDVEWHGCLRVYTKTRQAALAFDPNWITMDTTVKVTATDSSGDGIYYADKRSGTIHNSIFNGMPLDGWWPGPNRDGQYPCKRWK
jgi:hypothetical protein